jgi:hypothetical protein
MKRKDSGEGEEKDVAKRMKRGGDDRGSFGQY